MKEIMMLIIAVFITSAIFIALIRFLKGPTIYDRIAAIDVLTLITTVILVILAIYYKEIFYMDTAIVYAILSFIGVVAFARFMERKND